MPRGRRPGPGTAEEKAALRRERVRLNVQAFRKRKAGSSTNDESKDKSNLRWVSGSKWQAEYDERQHHPDEISDEESDESPPSNGAIELSLLDDDDDEGAPAEAEEFLEPVMMLHMTPDLNKQYSYALLASLPARFLPHRVSIPSIPDGFINIRTPCALWVTSACKLAQTNDVGPLKDSLMSMVLSLAAQEQNRPDLSVTSQRLYTRSLAKTRSVLHAIVERKQLPAGLDIASVFLACHTAAVYELFVNGSMEDMVRHVMGVGILIQHLQSRNGISGTSSVIGDSLIEEYRMLQMNFSMMYRRPSTIKAYNIKTNPSSTTFGTSIFTELLDLADQVPPVMVEIDKLRPKQQSNPSYCAERLDALITILADIHSKLKVWCDILREKLVEKSLGDIFTPDEITLDTSAITSYEFAATWMFSCSYDAYAIETFIEALEFFDSLEQSPGKSPLTMRRYDIGLLRRKLIANAGGVIDIMPYFFQPDKGIVGRSIAIWPLEGAWSTLESEELRLRRDEADLDRLDASIEVKIKVQEQKVHVMNYLKMCRDWGAIAKSYGLPMFKER